MPTGFLKQKRALPNLGIGLGLRRELAEETLGHKSDIDFLEVIPENYMGVGGRARSVIKRAAESFPLISHGVNLSIGSADELNLGYLQNLKNFVGQYNIAWFSDHLCFTSVNAHYVHDLLPMPFTKEVVNYVVERIKRVQDFVGRPFLLENISFYMNMPGSTMTEDQFLSEILEGADCGLLLDVNNVYVNSLNHNFDPLKYLDLIPMDRVVQIHVAGHKKGKEMVIDTHGAPVIEPVLKLLADVLKRTEVKGILLERDQNFPQFSEILSELKAIRAVAQASTGEKIANFA